MDKVEIGKRIRQRRIELNMTQEDLAKRVGYTSENSRSTINKVEMGINDIPRSKLPLYARALDVSIDYLISDEPSEEPVTDHEHQEWEGKYNHNGILAQRCRILDEVNGAFGAGADRLLDNFGQLNTSGKKKAVEALEDLAAIDKYRKEDD